MHDIGTLDRIRTSQQIARLEATTRPIRTSRSIPINTGRRRMRWSRVKETEEMALKEKHLEAGPLPVTQTKTLIRGQA